jgi:hypothetical protein
MQHSPVYFGSILKMLHKRKHFLFPKRVNGTIDAICTTSRMNTWHLGLQVATITTLPLMQHVFNQLETAAPSF